MTVLAEYTVSISIYGAPSSDPYVGITLHPSHSHQTMCRIHRVRGLDEERFSYDPRTQPLEDSILYGRCELRRDLTAKDLALVENALENFGQDETKLPERGHGNCQSWLAEAVKMLEVEGFIGVGEGKFWTERVGEKAEEMKKACLEQGKIWGQGHLQKTIAKGEGTDANYEQTQDNNEMGRLSTDERFKEVMEGLNAAFQGRG